MLEEENQTNKQTNKNLRHFADLKLNKSRNLRYFSRIIATLRYLSEFCIFDLHYMKTAEMKKKKNWVPLLTIEI